MGLLHPQNNVFGRVYQQNVLYFCRILGFFYIIFCLQKHIKVIFFWYKCNTIVCSLHSQKSLISYLIIIILHKGFWVLLVQVIVKFVFFQVGIIDVVFQVLLKTIPEKFYLLYSLISCIGVCHSELHQNVCCLYVIVLVNVY